MEMTEGEAETEDEEEVAVFIRQTVILRSQSIEKFAP